MRYERTEPETMKFREQVSREEWSLEGFFDRLGLMEYFSVSKSLFWTRDQR